MNRRGFLAFLGLGAAAAVGAKVVTLEAAAEPAMTADEVKLAQALYYSKLTLPEPKLAPGAVNWVDEQHISPPLIGPKAGDWFHNTGTGKLYTFNGDSWVVTASGGRHG